MRNKLDPAYVIDALQRLKRSNAKVFGSDAHEFLLNPRLSLREISGFENNYQIVLPDGYRTFISKIGNGGAGPAYGFFPLGYVDAATGEGLQAWKESGDIVGDLSEPFPFSEPWNDLAGMPHWNKDEVNNERYEIAQEEFDARYWSSVLVNGAVPLCHLGCALRIWLLVSGVDAGNLWYDYRADYRGYYPSRSKMALKRRLRPGTPNGLKRVCRFCIDRKIANNISPARNPATHVLFLTQEIPCFPVRAFHRNFYKDVCLCVHMCFLCFFSSVRPLGWRKTNQKTKLLAMTMPLR